MPVDVTKVLVGVATLYTAPTGTAIPADTVAEGAVASPWIMAGATEEGVSLINGTDTVDIRIEEQSTPARVLINTRNARVTVALSEDTIDTMKLSYGGGTKAVQAPATGVPGVTTLSLSDNLDEISVLLEGLNGFNFWRRIYIPRAVSVADVTTTYRRAANNRSYTAEIRAICPSQDIKIREKTAAAV